MTEDTDGTTTGPWIKWEEGGPTPVEDSEMVEVLFRNGIVNPSKAASEWEWQHDEKGTAGREWNITSFRRAPSLIGPEYLKGINGVEFTLVSEEAMSILGPLPSNSNQKLSEGDLALLGFDLL